MEPLTAENTDRFVMFPVRYTDIWELFQTHRRAYWNESEIDLSKDRDDWNLLTEGEQYFIKHVLAFFAASDGIVLENLALRFMKDVQIPEARAFYAFQMAMEVIHGITYSLMLDTYITDPTEKSRLFKAVDTIPVVGKKAQWAQKWIESSQNFAERLVAFACVEGIFFSGSFCSIYWLKERGVMPGFCQSNDLIARDEGLHCVAPETLILTRNGYKSISTFCGEMVEVWNGYEWSEVAPLKTGTDKPLYRVTLNNGTYLDCTNMHTWYVAGTAGSYIKKCTHELVPGDRIRPFTIPFLDLDTENDNEEAPDRAFTQGMFSALGYIDTIGKHPIVELKGMNVSNTRDLLARLEFSSVWSDKANNMFVVYLYKNTILPSSFVPLNRSLKYKLLWISGYLAGKRITAPHAVFESPDHLFVTRTQLLLTTILQDVPPMTTKTMHDASTCEILLDPEHLTTIQRLCTRVLEGMETEAAPLESGCVTVTVESMEDTGRVSDTYCFTEHKNHTALFNGITTGQCDLAVLMYSKYMTEKLPTDRVHKIVNDAVEIEMEFITEAIPCKLLGMNADMMTEYIRFVANRLVQQLGHEDLYANVTQPFAFMNRICYGNKGNFFERETTQYQLSVDTGVGNNNDDLDFDAAF